MAQLGVSEEYEAWLVDSDTEEPRYRLPWSSINWQRVRNNVSVASVLVAEADGGRGCCDVLQWLFPWSTLLRIERNGQPVWDGPVTGWSRPSVGERGPRGLVVRGHDRSALLYKRLVRSTVDVTDEVTAIAVLLLTDAGFGTAIDPYTFVVPTAVGLTGLDVSREYREDRLERVFDALTGLIPAGLFFTQHLSRFLVDEGAIRDSLGFGGERPRLSDSTVVDLPGFNVDGLEMTTVNYVGGATQGPSSYAFIGSSAYWAGTFLTATLEAGRSESRDVTQVDVDNDALYDTTRSAAPRFTIEQALLESSFGGSQMDADLSNLLPGGVLPVEFDGTCGFGLPVLDLAIILHGDDVWRPTPLASSAIEAVRIEQIDVTVQSADGGLQEEVRLSAIPYPEWDGSAVPTDWPWVPS